MASVVKKRVGWREAAGSPRKAAAYVMQGGRDLVEWARHMWAGIKLLGADVRVSAKILAKISHGKEITRRERNFMVQTGVDLGRLVPFSLFLIIPLAEFALPVALRLFPNMLPSQFQSQMQKEENMKRQLKANLELAKYLRDVVEKQAQSIKSSTKDSGIKKEAEQLAAFLAAIRSGQTVDHKDVSRFARLFSDELTLDGAVRPQLVAMCKYMGISAHGTDELLRFRLRSRLNSIKQDDMVITWEGGASSLTDEEIVKACRDRGIAVSGMEKNALRAQLSEWLEMSQDKAVPGSLMIMSRAFLYSGEDGIKETLSSLPDDLYEDVKNANDSGDGGNIGRLEEARRQSKLIEMESEREARKEAEKKRLEEEALAQAAENGAKEAEGAAAEGDAAETATAKAEEAAVAADAAVEQAATEGISDKKSTAAATAHEAKIIAEQFEQTAAPAGADGAPAQEAVTASAAGEGDATAEPAAAGEEPVVVEVAPQKDEDLLAREREAMVRVVDAFQALSSDSAVQQEREELANLKAELAEAESVLESLGGGSESELRRFKRMVTRLERQVENVDAKLGASMKLLDLDNDGVMSMDECVSAVKVLAGSEEDAAIVTEALRRLDADADGNISREDIHRLTRELYTETAGIQPEPEVEESEPAASGSATAKAATTPSS